MLFGVSFSRLFSMVSGMAGMPTRGVSVMCRFFVVATFVMLGSFLMVARGKRMMLRGLLVVFSSLLGH
jgi:hypothetical protein